MERYTTEHLFHQWYEHWHRYFWVLPLIKDLQLADLACGEGYGAALLAQHAKHVTALDIDAATIQKAQQKYPQDNIRFVCADVLNTGLAANQLDCITSFETLEHLAEHEALLFEFKRLLKQDGVLIISTPDTDVYNPEDKHNHHHVKELDRVEFQGLLSRHFAHSALFGQQLQLASVIKPIDNQAESVTLQAKWVQQGKEFTAHKDITKPQYLLAIATDCEQNLEKFKHLGGSCFNDSENSLYKHHEQQLQRLQSVDKRMPELEQQVQRQATIINHLKARLGL
ncbi:hypothetical protein GCM10011365_01700 [Marinicella pacifica]|uniref:Methyltransferase type 11 domain-containing protein n=1 Tax=Marinicella pacifica TaxID=1171543 RepID=A0A917FJV1_9GAMM|nr:class I SAM-dependent methyltransferase [Marinicella pacifica]GGF84407.1 hypothetical protein GCM10011365_01700 [Marinicella pacifica]